MHRIKFFLLLILFVNSCILLPMPERKLSDEKLQLIEIMELSKTERYEQAVEKCQEFMKEFPESEYYDIALMKLGDGFKGLVEQDYLQLIKDGQSEEEARKNFLGKYGHYQCWLEGPCGIQYNLECFKEMMERFPDSNYADEATYHLIPWVCDYKGLPEGPLEEIGYLEKILQKYPTSSLRSEVYYQVAHRFHIIYEIYAFSPQAELRNTVEAKKYREKSLYFYRLVLKQPVQSKFSRSAWEDIKKLEEGERIYIMQ